MRAQRNTSRNLPDLCYGYKHFKMKKEGKTNFWQRLKKGFGRRDNQAKLFFLVLSVFLWFLIKLSKEEGFVQTIDFPVVYENFPSHKELKNNPPEQISIRLKAQGFNLLKYTFRSFKPIVVDVEALQAVRGEEHGYWLTNSQQEFIERQLEADVEVLSIRPDTIHFRYSKLLTKKLPVRLQLKKNFSAFTSLYAAPQLFPDSIEVIGSVQQLAELDSIVTEPLYLNDDQDSVYEKISLQLPAKKGLSYSHKQVGVGLRLVKLTEKSFEQDIEIRNAPDSVDAVVFPGTVSVQVQLALQDFGRLQSIDITPYVNIADIFEQPDETQLRVRLDELPGFVRAVILEPKRVEFILTKK